VAAALPSFDNGFWSWYWISENGPPYIASMGYHMLHVRLLSALGERTGNTELIQRAEHFESYARKLVNRSRAGFQMVRNKAKKTTKKFLAGAARVTVYGAEADSVSRTTQKATRARVV